MGFYDDDDMIDDDEYYEDDEYTEDDEEVSSSRSVNPFRTSGSSSTSGLPGRSRFGGSRFGGDDDEDDDDDESGRPAARSAASPTSRFGTTSSVGPGRFGARSGDDDKKDDDDKDDERSGGGVSRFSGSTSRFSSPSSNVGPGRFGARSGDDDKKEDDKKDDERPAGGASRFSGGGSGTSRFGSPSGGGSSSGGDSSASGSRFGGGSSAGGGGSGTSRFGSPSGGGSSSSGGGDSSASGSRFGGGSSSGGGSPTTRTGSTGPLAGSRPGDAGGEKKDDKPAEKKPEGDKPAGGGIAGRLGGVASRFGGGSSEKKDDKPAEKKPEGDKPAGGGIAGRLGGVASRFGGGSAASGDKPADKPADKPDAPKPADKPAATGGGIASRLGGVAGVASSLRPGSKPAEGGAKPEAKPAEKKPETEKPGGTRFGALGGSLPRFGAGKKDEAAKPEAKPTAAKGTQSALGQAKASGAAKNAPKSATKTEANNMGLGARLSAALPFGGAKADNKKAEGPRSKTRASKVPQQAKDGGLSLDDKLDILGVGLTFAAIVLFISSLSGEQGAITSAFNDVFVGLFGWGSIFVPLIMGAVGGWLIFRHFGENAPEIDPVRISGLAVLFTGALMTMMFIETFSPLYNQVTNVEELMLFLEFSVEQGRGGGEMGAFFYSLLVSNVGEIGAVIVIFGWLVVGIMLATRTSAAELAVFVISIWRSFQIAVERRAVRQRAIRAEQAQAKALAVQQAQISVSRPEPATLPAGVAAAALPAPEEADEEGDLIPIEERAIPIRMGGQMINANSPQPAQPAPPPARNPGAAPAASKPEEDGKSGLFGSLVSKVRSATPSLPLIGGSSGSDDGNTGGNTAGNTASTAAEAPKAPAAPPAASPEAPAAASLGSLLNARAAESGRSAAPASPTPPAGMPQAPASTPQTPQQPAAQMPPPATTSQTPPAAAQAAPQPESGGAPIEQRRSRLDEIRAGLARQAPQADGAGTAPAATNGTPQTAAPAQPATSAAPEDQTPPAPTPREPVRPRPFESPAAAQPAAQPGQERKPLSPFRKPGEEDGQRDITQTPSFRPPATDAATPPRVTEAPRSEPVRMQTPHQEASRPPAAAAAPRPAQPAQPALPRRQWKMPEFRTLLASGSEQDFDRNLLVQRARTIEETLQSFGAPGRVVEINTGPVITQFGVEPDYLTARGGKRSRVKVSAIAQLDKDLQLALGAKSIRIEAPVPGKGYVGIEVPNEESSLVSLRDVMEAEQFKKIKSPLAIALGQSVDGTPVAADLTSMPHLLIAGTTGSGKSVCVNAVITSLILENSPEMVKFIMVDPKRVELTGYNGIPHLIAPVVVELERIVGVLKWVTREMDERYKKFSNAGARNIVDYNQHLGEGLEKMPYIVVIIDELADLMMLAPEETERVITRIAALARATGIHLVIATQRPSVDVVTGLIKANFPARIAFAVAGSVDSRVILDQPGAERLLGKGDMLYLSGDSPAPLRLQGVYVSDMEINNITRFWKSQDATGGEQRPITMLVSEEAPTAQPRTVLASPSSFTSSFSSGSSSSPSAQRAFWDNDDDDDDDVDDGNEDGSGDHDDALYEEAVELVRRLDKASVSLLQRRLRIGYTRAARLIDTMEAEGIIGPPTEGSKPRKVLK
ncbi:MAG: hypothetical protein OHK0046_35090 [Anaerolineae bacterium]